MARAKSGTENADRATKARGLVEGQLRELAEIEKEARRTPSLGKFAPLYTGEALEHLRRWRDRTIRQLREGVRDAEADRLARMGVASSPYTDAAESFNASWEQFRSFLSALLHEIKKHPGEFAAPATPAKAAAPTKKPNGRDVFVVHGRDSGTKETVARFLQTLKLNPLILHEKANQGRTLIEKIEAHANVAFAVVILTPDDEGHLAKDPKKKKPRARQNVVLELGLFIGRLGRKNVCVLHKRGIELPSDIDGLAYVSLDDGDWKVELARELKAADIQIDMNLVF